MDKLEALQRRLADGMAGTVAGPGEPAYEQTVSIWAKPKVLPQLVAHCVNTADVQLAVRSAWEAGIALSVRGGGHDWTGRALCGGLTIDLRRMNGVGPIGDDLTIEVGAGVKGTDVFIVTDPAGVAPVLGSVADVGLVGLVTGGGYSPLMRRRRLACDNLLAATVVLANGQVVRAAEDDDAELLWALRGGGGNFGVVTSMVLKLYPLPRVRSGILLFPFESGDAVLPRLRQIWDDAPIDLDVQFGIVPGPDGNLVLYISPTWSGDPAGAETALAPLYALEGRIMDDVRDQPFGASRAFFDQHIVSGLVTSADTAWLREWNREIAHIVMGAMRCRPSRECFVLGHDFSGAAAEVPESSTAFGLRKPHIWFEAIAPAEPNGSSDGSAEAAWAQDVVESLAPYAFAGGYPNLLGPLHKARTQFSFGDNAARLIAAKRRYDPDNVFRSAIALPEAELATDAVGA